MVFYKDLLQETLDEIENMFFWKDEIELDESKYIVIHDFEQAFKNAFNEVFYYDWDEEDSEIDEMYWSDILENNMSLVWEKVFVEDDYKDLSSEVQNIIIPRLKTTDDYNGSIYEEMSNELICCAQARYVCGKENKFFEHVYSAYKAGGWPCGWDDGKIIVYVPEDKYKKA